MNITLLCQYEAGEANFSPARIQGIEAPRRRYLITNHQVVLAGYDMAVLCHDADELLHNPAYRMLTPAEQEAMAAAQAKARQIQEEALAALAARDVTADTDKPSPPASEPQQESVPESKPEPLLSLSAKKKNGGG